MVDGDEIATFFGILREKLEDRFGRPAALMMSIAATTLLVGAAIAIAIWLKV